MVTGAFVTLGRASPGGWLFTCEHASRRLPHGHSPSHADNRLLATHWGWDIGAADLTRALCHGMGAGAVFSNYTRLLCDPNRAPGDPSMFLRDTDDGAPSFNAILDDGERERRLRRYFHPFHKAVARFAMQRPRLLLSIHSFTPAFRGRARAMEAGVLFDQHDDLAQRLALALASAGLATALNEPYSGKDGLIYSAARHGGEAGVPYLELEVRQDLIDTQPKAAAVAKRVQGALLSCGI